MISKTKMFLTSLPILIIVSILFSRELVTANVIINQSVIAYDNKGAQFAIICPSGSVVMSPEYFDRLADSIALKDELIGSGKIRPENKTKLEKKIYLEVKDGITSAPDAIAGAKIEYTF